MTQSQHDRWLGSKAQQTADAYQEDARDFAKWQGGACWRQQLDAFLTLSTDAALDVGNRWKADMLKRSLSPNTINRRLSTLRSRARFERTTTGSGPYLDDLKGVKKKTYKDLSPVTGKELAKWLTYYDKDGSLMSLRDKAMVLLMVHGGLSRGDVASMDRRDVSLAPDPRDTTIRHTQRSSVNDKVRSGVTDEVHDALAAWMRASDATMRPLFYGIGGRNAGHRLEGGTVWRRVTDGCRRAGLRRITTRQLRQTFVMEALNQGARLHDVQKAIGHKDPAVTKSYRKQTPSDTRAIGMVVANALRR